MKYLILAALLLLTGCISTDDPNATFSTVRVAPMGSHQYMITCLDSPVYCARQANRECPNYDVVSNSTAIDRTTMIVKCH